MPLSTKLTPVGRDPDSDRAGVGDPVVVTVNVPAPPTVKMAPFGEVMVGATGAGFTVRENGTACAADAAVPVTVIGEVPVGVDVVVVTVMVELCPAVTTCGLNDTVAPDGAPVALSDTDWVDPLVIAVVMVLVVPDPAFTVPEVGLAEMEKSFGGEADPALNSATPAAQYMAVPNVPEKLCGAGGPTSL